jgi:hypothetical protein
MLHCVFVALGLSSSMLFEHITLSPQVHGEQITSSQRNQLQIRDGTERIDHFIAVQGEKITSSPRNPQEMGDRVEHWTRREPKIHLP